MLLNDAECYWLSLGRINDRWSWQSSPSYADYVMSMIIISKYDQYADCVAAARAAPCSVSSHRLPQVPQVLVGIGKKWWFGEWRKFAINWINDVPKNNDDLVNNSAGNPGYSHLAEDVELCSKVVVCNLIETSCVRPLILSRGNINMIRKRLTGCKK